MGKVPNLGHLTGHKRMHGVLSNDNEEDHHRQVKGNIGQRGMKIYCILGMTNSSRWPNHKSSRKMSWGLIVKIHPCGSLNIFFFVDDEWVGIEGF